MKRSTRPLTNKGHWKMSTIESGERYWEMSAGPFVLKVVQKTPADSSKLRVIIEVNDEEYQLPGTDKFLPVAMLKAEQELRKVLTKLNLGLGVRNR